MIRNLPGGRLAKVGSMNREDADVRVLDNSQTDWVQSRPEPEHSRRRLKEILRAAGSRAPVISSGRSVWKARYLPIEPEMGAESIDSAVMEPRT